MRFFRVERIVMIFAVVGLISYLLYPAVKKRVNQQDRFDRIAQALEAYALDNNGQYPRPFFQRLPNNLTTPVPYLSASDMNDPLSNYNGFIPGVTSRFFYYNLADYSTSQSESISNRYAPHYGRWTVYSLGFAEMPGSTQTFFAQNQIYDATNGSISMGIMIRCQKRPKETASE